MSENTQEINLSLEETQLEINKFMSFQQKYNLQRKKIIKNEIRDLSNYHFNFKDKLLTFNLPIRFKQITDKSLNHIIYAIEILDNDVIVFKKEIRVPKYLDVCDELQRLNKIIQSKNYVIQLKNILSEINDLNNVSNNDEFVQNNGQILNKSEVDNYLMNLKNAYDNLKASLEKILNSKEYLTKYLYNEKNDIKDTLQKLEEINNFLTIENTKKYFAMKENLDDETCKHYLNHKKKIFTVHDNSNDLNIGRKIVYKIDDENIIGNIMSINDDIIMIKTETGEIINIDNTPENRNNINLITSNNYKLRNLLKKNVEKIIDIKHLINLQDPEFTFTSKVLMTKNFSGENYIKKGTKTENVAKIPVKKTTSKPKSIIIHENDVNVPDELKGKLYNQKNVLMFYSKSGNKPAGLGASETLNDSDFTELNNISNWRKKLSNFFISKFVHKYGISNKPIIIEGDKFMSVEHYFHYNKFSNRIDLGGNKKIQYQKYADKFKNNGEFSKLKGADVKSRGRHENFGLPNNWFSTDEYSLRSHTLKKALYAKFSQTESLKNLLLATNDSMIIHPSTGSPRTCKGKYEIQYELMIVRYLLKNDISPEFYTEFQSDKLKLISVKNEIISQAKIENEKNIQRQEFESLVLKEAEKEIASREKIPTKKNIPSIRVMVYTIGINNYDLRIDLGPSGEEKSEVSLDDNDKERVSQIIFNSSLTTRQKIIRLMELEFDFRSQKLRFDREHLNEIFEIFIEKGFLKEDRKDCEKANIINDTDSCPLDTIKLYLTAPNNLEILYPIKSKSENNVNYNQVCCIPERNTINIQLGDISNNTNLKNTINKIILSDDTFADKKTKLLSLNYFHNKLNKNFNFNSNYIDILLQGLSEQGLISQNPESRNYSKMSIFEKMNQEKIYMVNYLRKVGKFTDDMLQNRSKLEKAFFEHEMNISKKNLERNLTTLAQLGSSNEPPLYIIHQPPNGDCFYYSLSHGLNILGLNPMNFDSPNALSNNQNFRNVSVGSENYYQPVFTNATLSIRDILASKIADNLLDISSGEMLPEEDLTTYIRDIALPIMTENNGILFDYISSVQSSANYSDKKDGVDTGRWAGELEIILASAVFNLNIIIFNSSNNNRMEYLANNSRSNWPRGPVYNNSNVKTLYLGYLTNNHYTLMHTEPESVIRDPYTLLDIYITNIELDSKKYLVGLENQNGIWRFQGIFDEENSILKDITTILSNDEDDLDNSVEIQQRLTEKISELITTLDEETMINIEKISFYHNTTNQKIYTQDYEEIGSYRRELDDSSREYYKIIFR